MFRAPSLFHRRRHAPALTRCATTDPYYSFHREMNRLFDDFFDGFAETPTSAGSGVRGIRLTVDETDNAFEIEAELPGVDEEDLHVELTDNVLTIRGEKKSEETGEDGARRSFASFQRSLSVPFDVDPDAVEATLKNGVLRLTLPKPAEPETKARQIRIRRG